MIEGQVTFEVRALLTSQSFHDLDTSPIVHYWKAAGSRPDNSKFQEKQPNFTLCTAHSVYHDTLLNIRLIVIIQ